MADEAEWRIGPDSGYLTYPQGRDYTAGEFARQRQPPCPSCGMEVLVELGDASHMGAREPQMYVPVGWRCPEGCLEGLARPREM